MNSTKTSPWKWSVWLFLVNLSWCDRKTFLLIPGIGHDDMINNAFMLKIQHSLWLHVIDRWYVCCCMTSHYLKCELQKIFFSMPSSKNQKCKVSIFILFLARKAILLCNINHRMMFTISQYSFARHRKKKTCWANRNFGEFKMRSNLQWVVMWVNKMFWMYVINLPYGRQYLSGFVDLPEPSQLSNALSSQHCSTTDQRMVQMSTTICCCLETQNNPE